LFDRRSRPVLAGSVTRIWGRHRPAASVRRLNRCGRGGPDSRSGRSKLRL